VDTFNFQQVTDGVPGGVQVPQNEPETDLGSAAKARSVLQRHITFASTYLSTYLLNE